MNARRPFGTTWWGRAWIEALEAQIDPVRLSRGRSYARSGAVVTLDLAPGRVSASVAGRRPQPYTVTVSIRAFTDAEWERLLDVVSSRIAHAAALLDGELPPSLVADVASAGLSLLPGPGELVPRCSCPDVAEPCKHAAAVCLLVADLLDNDPFELLLLRGRTRGEVLSALRSRRAGAAVAAVVTPVDADEVDARDAYAQVPGPLPDLPLPPVRPGRPAPMVGSPPPGTVHVADLTALATDAAARAWALLTGAGDGGLALTYEEDLARRATELLGTTKLDRLAKRAGIAPRQLSRRAEAWSRGGRGALDVLEDTWSPDDADVAEAVAALGGGAHVWRNQVSDASDSRQLRLGRDGLWYPLRRVGGAWKLVGPANADPAAALAGAA